MEAQRHRGYGEPTIIVMSPDLELTRKIVLDGLAGTSARVFLFGSWARGQQRRYSDIDVAILPQAPIPPGLFLELEERLDSAAILHPVNLVDLSHAPASLRKSVLAEGVPWTE